MEIYGPSTKIFFKSYVRTDMDSSKFSADTKHKIYKMSLFKGIKPFYNIPRA